MIKFVCTLIVLCTFCTPAFSGTFLFDDGVEKDQQHIALRKVGHELLLNANDATSRVLPIQQVDGSTYEIHFEHPFALHPDALIEIIANEEKKGYIPQNYIVQVYDVATNTVQYAYSMPTAEADAVPCLGRALPKDNYYITIQFIETNNVIWYAAGVIPLFVLFGWHQLRTTKKKAKAPVAVQPHVPVMIGACKYFPDLQKLEVKNTVQSLTAKEAKVLNIFATNVNTEVTRERIQKEVWEDEGVIVGRSLDMFISKLRKKFKDEPAIQIVSIHGKGYKLIAEA
ncbi:helix-turn-helix domain-containing protein [Flavobacterium litorale]|uniref:Helix-turn-helix domain-containing protein n=1 Tax=Flavobacterium litorale TaxID=2856519 RepID=A0ABX8V8J6_9FLAO|nr:helix-turn-helix domain-containing protein [Flavobacterium litorale]QYJ69169.1 helix-turn-helix domain-containing protein [Flavobacterium litorale]